MYRVDRLLIEAKKRFHAGLPELTLAMIERNGDCWTATAHLWNRIPGDNPTIEKATRATLEAAIDYINALADYFPNSRDVTIIVDDILG